MLHRIHRVSGMLVGLFVLAHLINHLFILSSVEHHIAVMEALRSIYQLVPLEVLLIVCLVFQLLSGLYFVWKRRGWRRGFFQKAQALSGLYLVFFLLNHMGAVVYGREVLSLDTNIYFGIAGLQLTPFKYFFIPYYFLGVLAVFVHIAAAFHYLCRDRIPSSTRMLMSYLMIGIGVLISLILMMAFVGVFEQILVPDEYRELYD